MNNSKNYIENLITRAKTAQKIAENFSQEKVDELAAAITWEIAANNKLVEELAISAYEETKMGDIPSKISKVTNKCRGVYYDVKNVKTVGITEDYPELGISKISKPVGIIGSLVPSTQPEMHPIIQSIFGVKARDAIIFSPHPNAKNTTLLTVEKIRNVMKKYDAPEDLFICIDNPSLESTNILMEKVDLIIATGGQNMVKSAYSSGTPAFGVGAGNANIIIDKTADLTDAANKIKSSKTFDLAAGCSCDNSVIIHESIYDDMVKEFEKVGAYLVPNTEKNKLQKAIWPNYPSNNSLNRDIIARPTKTIAEIANIKIPENTSMLLVEEDKTGVDSPFSGEKMSLVITLYKFNTIDEAINIVNDNQSLSGAGHSCGIYSKTKENIDKVAKETYTTRVVVNQPQAATNTGNWISGMPFTSTLSCGTWGGNIVSENIALKHYMNNTFIIREIPSYEPTDEELFHGFIPR